MCNYLNEKQKSFNIFFLLLPLIDSTAIVYYRSFRSLDRDRDAFVIGISSVKSLPD